MRWATANRQSARRRPDRDATAAKIGSTWAGGRNAHGVWCIAIMKFGRHPLEPGRVVRVKDGDERTVCLLPC